MRKFEINFNLPRSVKHNKSSIVSSQFSVEVIVSQIYNRVSINYESQQTKKGDAENELHC